MAYLEVKVTQDDIDRGVRGSPFHCALACALQRVTRDPTVSVGAKGWYDTLNYHPLSRRAITFMNAYDFGKIVRPTTFRLEAP